MAVTNGDGAVSHDALRRHFAAAHDKLEPHLRAPTHACSVVHRLIQAAPDDAHIFDTVAHAFRVAQLAGVPPGLGGHPAKPLVLAAFAEYCAAHPSKRLAGCTAEEAQTLRKEALAEWTDLSELLAGGLTLLLQRFGSAAGGPEGSAARVGDQ